MFEAVVIIGGTANLFLLAVLVYFASRKPNVTYLGGMKEFDPNKDVTTVVPLTLGSATCVSLCRGNIKF